MKKYQIEVKEVLSRAIEVEANNEDEALDKVYEMYDNEKIVLDWHDLVEHEIDFIREVKNNG